jgi:hypothetical protein
MSHIKRSFEKSTEEEEMMLQREKNKTSGQRNNSASFYNIADEKLGAERKSLLKRISPFLLLVLFLVVLFPYMMITGEGAIRSEWLLIFLFPFTIANLLLTDFAIWNYFRGKKIGRIWLIELTLSVLIIHMLI